MRIFWVSMFTTDEKERRYKRDTARPSQGESGGAN
jgi:hypothetical protein